MEHLQNLEKEYNDIRAKKGALVYNPVKLTTQSGLN
jgi:hypothetical protein